MPITALESLPPEILDSYTADVYANLPFLMRSWKPRNCRFLVATETPGDGAVCIWRHPLPEMSLVAIFTTGVLDIQMSLFRSLEPGRYLFDVPDGELATTLAQELRFSEIHSNRVYSRESDSHLNPGEARLLGPDDVPVVEPVHPHLARMLQRGISVFGIIEDGELITSCRIVEILDRHWEIANVYTQEAFRHKGYGKSVVSAATDYIRGHGRVPVYECDQENTPSIRLAESLGFSLKATQLEAEAHKA